MNIGFDAKRAFLNKTGLGNYSRTLIRSLAAYFPENNYFLYTTKLAENQESNYFPEGEYKLRSAPPMIPKSLWRSRLLLPQLRKDKLQIYHGLSHELPFGLKRTTIRSIVTIHDLIFLRYPHLYPFIDRKIYQSKIRYACNIADMVVAISEQTKKDIVRFIGISPEKIKVIYQSCSENFRRIHGDTEKENLRQKYGLPDRFLLYVGTIEERKNLLLITKALCHLPKETKLVVVGKKTAYFDQVSHFLKQKNLMEQVTFLSNIPFEELSVLYQTAEIFIYPSRFEGFGIPILEALCSGIPVIAATGSCLEEAGGSDSIYISPDDDKGLAEVISKISANKELSSKMAARGKAYAQRFTSDKIATQIMNMYRNVIAG